MLEYRDPKNTTIVSISKACIDDFTNYYGQLYTKFPRQLILHPSEIYKRIDLKQYLITNQLY